MRILCGDGRMADWPAVAGAARRLAARLGEGGPVVNLCEDRRAFLSVLVATAICGRSGILPSDRSPEGIRSVAERYPDAVGLHDGGEVAQRAAQAGLAADPIGPEIWVGEPDQSLDATSLDETEIVMFTSGSTGAPEPCARRLSFFRQGAVANAACMFEGFVAPAGIVATVPPYHMFGFELSIAVPLYAGGTLFAGRPFYPADVAVALEATPSPRVLVSTPVHLRALNESGMPMPPTERVFSATAPLSASLARDIESLFGADLREIFGTTETGSIGWRNTAHEDSFRLMRGMELKQAGGGSLVSASHIKPPFPLADRLESIEGGSFHIAGRSNDIVNIAGKRMSLAGMNAILGGIDGVLDGAFLPPGDDADGPVRRTAAVVVAPGLSAEDIRRALRDRLDSAFLPRRIAFVDALPRNAAGKLPLGEFRRFASEALARQDSAEWTVRFAADEPWVQDHFPDRPIVPGAILLGEAGELVADWLGLGDGPVELVSARFPDSALPGTDCVFRVEPAAGGQYRVECSQGGRVVMKASLRLPARSDG